jgi:hypothetical protein
MVRDVLRSLGQPKVEVVDKVEKAEIKAKAV